MSIAAKAACPDLRLDPLLCTTSSRMLPSVIAGPGGCLGAIGPKPILGSSLVNNVRSVCDRY